MSDAVFLYLIPSQSPEYLIVEEPSFFDQFTMIIATSLSDTLALKLANICEASKTPVFLVKCLGFTGMFRIQAGENTSKIVYCWRSPIYVALTDL
jgi:hypothetical protein